jgi:hypothetical protein
MTLNFSLTLVVAVAVSSLGLATPVSAQPLLNNTPNTVNPLTTPVGSLDFVFIHRFDTNGGPNNTDFEASPTLTLTTGILPQLDAELNYAMASLVNVAGSNGKELEALLKYRCFPVESPYQLDVMAAYNTAAISGDAALMASYDVGPVNVRAVGKAFTSGLGVGGKTVAVGAGAIWHVNKNWGLSADYSLAPWSQNPLSAGAVLPAWGVGANFLIPYSPHSFQLYATNANSLTLQGTSVGDSFTSYGFAFIIPFGSLDRYIAIFNPPKD